MNAKLIFNVSDLWPESAEKLGLVSNKFFLRLAYILEAKCYQRSYLITGQTQGIVQDIRKRFPEKDVYWLPNGVNLINYDPIDISQIGFRNKYGIAENDLVFFYGGILGHAQGLELMLRVSKRFEGRPIKFVLMGSGPMKTDLLELATELDTKNVIFADPVTRAEMASVLQEIDVSLIPLRKIDLFLGAIPSKIFEVLAMEKPILLGVDGEAKELFISEGNSGWYFEPENIDDLEIKINEIAKSPELIRSYGKNGRAYVAEKFNRNRIAEHFYNYLLYRLSGTSTEEILNRVPGSVTIVIPCRNEEKHIAECINAIYACDIKSLELEVIVVDGMSTDNTIGEIEKLQKKYPSLRVIQNEKQVTPVAFNLGIIASKGEYIQIVGARQVISKNYLLDAKRILQGNSDVWCVGGGVVNLYQNKESEIIGLAMGSSFGVGGGNFRVLKKSGYTDTVGTPMYPRRVFDEIGLFDEALLRNQDDELNFRITSKGRKIYLNTEIQIKYYVRAKLSNLFKQYFQYGYWKVYVNKMHGTITSVRQLVPLFFVLGLIVGLSASIFLTIALWVYLSWLSLYIFLAIVFGIYSAKSFVKGLRVALVFPVLHFSYGWGYLKGLVDFVIFRRRPRSTASNLSR